MKLVQHISVGKSILKELGETEVRNQKINKMAYLLGNIAPDLNCIYPAHRLCTTEKRFYNRLKRIDKWRIPVLKSFTLGVVTHYVCDYFCYAHSIESIGVMHKKYENNLYQYYLSHLEEIENTNKDIKDMWNKALKEKQFKLVISKESVIEKHCKMIMEQVKYMNNIYKSNYERRNNKWEQQNKQVALDMKYITAIAQCMTMLILEPFKASFA